LGKYLLISAIAAVLLISACSREAPEFRQQFFAFGTLIEVTLYGVDDATARRAVADVERDFNALHAAWHAWQDSELTRVNAAIAAGQPAPVDADLGDLITRARTLSIASGGLFNPAIGGLLTLWGFHADERADGPPPAEAAIAALLSQHPSMTDVALKGDKVSSANPAVQFDFGACAKGYAADRAIAHLRTLGIDNAIIAAAGDLHAIGAHGDRPWRIGIRHPRKPGIIAGVDLRSGESISTSGDYERFFTYAGRRFHHILDPRSGQPATGISSVTVIHPDGITADTAATALFIAGPDDWAKVARDMGVQYVLLIDTDGTAHATAQMAARLQFEPENKPALRIGEP
jgi:thiamine biosynthesis lipoprotein